MQYAIEADDGGEGKVLCLMKFNASNNAEVILHLQVLNFFIELSSRSASTLSSALHKRKQHHTHPTQAAIVYTIRMQSSERL
jgi:hypothetical protein